MIGSLLGTGVFSDSLGTFRNGVFCQFTRKKKSNSGLDFSRADGASFIVVGQSRGFSGDSFEDVVNETVHDGHSFGADSGVWVNLFQYLVNVDAERFLSLCSPSLLLVAWRGLFDSFFGSFGWCHSERCFGSVCTVRVQKLVA